MFRRTGRVLRPEEELLITWPEKDRRMLLKAAGRVEYEPGDVLVSEGCIAKEFVLLTSGQATLMQRGRRAGVLMPGEHIGAVPLLYRSCYEQTAVTDRFCEALVLGARDFNGLLHSVPSFGRMLTTGLADVIVTQQRATVRPLAGTASA